MNNQIQCICGTCQAEENYYVCAGCQRTAPWCFGGGDKYYDYCDDCALLLDRGVAPSDLCRIINRQPTDDC